MSSPKAPNSPKRGAKIGKPKLRVVHVQGPALSEPTPQDTAYFAALHKLIDAIYEEAADTYGYTWAQLAVHANLSYLTVANLGDRETKYPRFQTVYKLAKAVGWSLVIGADKKRRAAPARLKVVG
jgi:hypothetical protein